MKILWLTWKDKKNPLSGGAETINEALAERLARAGNEVIFLTAGFSNSLPEEEIGGYKIIRLGGRWTVYWQAFIYYRNNLRGWADLVIDEVNTIPFFAKFYAGEKNILFVHQLCREIWFYEIFFPLNLLGYFLEPIYLWLLRDRRVVTVSQSTKNDLLCFGFNKNNIQIISEGIDIEPAVDLAVIEKFSQPTILCLGAMRRMKRTEEIITAFELVRDRIPESRLVIAGSASGRDGEKILKHIKASRHREAIEYLGRVSREKKIELMRRAHILAVTSVKEGWGLVVTEANSQGTPALVYNVDGLRDAVKDGETGLICSRNNHQVFASAIIKLLSDKDKYESLRRHAWQWSQEINFEKSYADFVTALNNF
jgi:glycosyltransferase involved in cell wall biosynthesis